MSTHKDAQAERVTLLELVAYWEGRVNTILLTHHFGISRQYVSADLKRYRELAPDNLWYCASAKSCLAGIDFQPILTSADVAQYLNWLGAGFPLQNAKLQVITRACQVQYPLNEMQVNTEVLDGIPEAQRLVLVNQADIRGVV
ncbi:hypothetical protein [Marinimicrobium locisalis]|uniref:hypothetical protein n=1 Tax=Marinimicrobium locisalis TaxID=546022 RepID=UPI0032216331